MSAHSKLSSHLAQSIGLQMKELCQRSLGKTWIDKNAAIPTNSEIQQNMDQHGTSPPYV